MSIFKKKNITKPEEDEHLHSLFEEQITSHSEQPIHPKSLWNKTGRYAKQVGMQAIYSVLLLYHAFRRKETPAWAKRIITGILAYFVSPIDLIPDLTPFIGFTDDIGLIGFGLVMIASYVNDDVRKKSREQLKKWFGDYDEKELDAIDDKL